MSEPRKKRGVDEMPVDMEKMALTITVSLFMAVLAFFIVLNTFSSVNTNKLKAMRESVEDAFGFVGLGMAGAESEAEGIGRIGVMEADMAAGLRSVLPDLGFQSRKVMGGQVMSVAIDRASMAERWPEIQSRIVSLLLNETYAGRYRMYIVMLDGPANTGEAIQMANDIADAGVSPEKLAIGYENRGLDSVELRFLLKKKRE